MINSVYNYYAAQYGHREYSKYDTHSKAQLKSTFGKLQKINSQTPSYKIDFSDAALKYAIDLKENARELSQIADELSDESTDSITYKRSATSSSPQVIDAEYIGDSCVQDYEPLEVTVSQLACPQTNTGNFLQPNSKPFAAGEYSFDLQVQNLTYQFEFGINATDTVTDTQQKIARLINQADIGLNAQLLTDGLGNSAISITSDATGIKGISPTIFHIQSQNSSDASDSNTELVSTLGLDRVTQYPANAVYSVNGTTATSVSNEVTIDNNYVLTFFDTTGKAPVTISMNTDTDAIADSIGELIGGYNNLISVTANDANEHFEGNEKLKKDFAGIAKSYNHLLNENGLSVTDNGTIAVDRDAIISAADNGTLGDIFSGLNAFKQAVQKKAEDISLNPMDYVNNKIIAYKNPLRPTNDPYNLSAYTGMIFDGYL
jgi:flagellar hook-associated protein 2